MCYLIHRRNDSFGKLGIGANEPVIVPRKPQRVLGELKEKRIVMVAAGSHHSLALSDEGTVYGWGMDEYGQTGELASSKHLGRIIVPPNVSFPDVRNVQACPRFAQEMNPVL